MTEIEIKRHIADLKSVMVDTNDTEEKAFLQEGIDKLEKQLKEMSGKKTPDKKTPAKKVAVSVLYIDGGNYKTEIDLKVDEAVAKTLKVGQEDVEIESLGMSAEKMWEQTANDYNSELDHNLVSIVKIGLADNKKPQAKTKKVVRKKTKKPTKSKQEPKKTEASEKPEPQPKISKELDNLVSKAVVSLNKKRYVLKEIKNRETGRTKKVHHTPEYRNSRIIRRKVSSLFDSSIHDISNSRKEKKENKEVIEKAKQLKDLFTILLNEIDIIINSTEKSDLDNIINLVKGLIKESLKNDPKDKYQKIAWLNDLVKKYNL